MKRTNIIETAVVAPTLRLAEFHSHCDIHGHLRIAAVRHARSVNSRKSGQFVVSPGISSLFDSPAYSHYSSSVVVPCDAGVDLAAALS